MHGLSAVWRLDILQFVFESVQGAGAVEMSRAARRRIGRAGARGAAQ